MYRVHRPKDLILLKCQYSWNYRFNTISVKISADFNDINKLILKFIWKHKTLRIVTLKRIKLEDSHYLIQNLLQGYSYQDCYTDIWIDVDKGNRTGSLWINPYIYTQLIFKCVKTIQCRKNSLFNKWCWNNWLSTCKWMKLDPFLLTPHTKMVGLNVIVKL